MTQPRNALEAGFWLARYFGYQEARGRFFELLGEGKPADTRIEDIPVDEAEAIWRRACSELNLPDAIVREMAEPRLRRRHLRRALKLRAVPAEDRRTAENLEIRFRGLAGVGAPFSFGR